MSNTVLVRYRLGFRTGPVRSRSLSRAFSRHDALWRKASMDSYDLKSLCGHLGNSRFSIPPYTLC